MRQINLGWTIQPFNNASIILANKKKKEKGRRRRTANGHERSKLLVSLAEGSSQVGEKSSNERASELVYQRNLELI